MAEYHSTEELLENTSVPRLILRLGVPAMFGQFFNILYSIVDRIFVGRISETGGAALAGIGVCAPALTAVTAFAYMVGIGGASYMSISLGQKDHGRAGEILGNAFLMLLGISAVVTAVLLAAKRPFLYMLGCSDAIYPYAEQYFTIYICGTAASLCGIGLNQFLLAQGFAKEGMFAVAMGAMINVILDPLLIFGAAAATVTAQCCMAGYVLFQICRRRTPVRLEICRAKGRLMARIVSIGSMSFLITVMDNLIIILLNVVLRKYGGAARGDQLIACAAVVQSFMTIVFCPAQGITTGCGTIFSYNYGSKHYGKIRQAFIGIFLLCGAYIGLLEVCVQVFPELFTGLFLRDESLLGEASASIRMYTLVLVGAAVQYALVDGVAAMGKVRHAFPMSVFRKMIYAACIFFLPMIWNVRYVFFAGSISDAVGAAFSIVFFFCVVNPKLKQELQ